jgi:hypothetical protein
MGCRSPSEAIGTAARRKESRRVTATGLRGIMTTAFARHRRAQQRAELSVERVLIALVAGLLLLCAASRSVAES